MFETVCAIPLSSDVFSQAIHPTEPIVSVGLLKGHVHTFRLPPGENRDVNTDLTVGPDNGLGRIETTWSTRRHQGSCRALCFGYNGQQLYSAGTDGLVKSADVASGRVVSKIAIPEDTSVMMPRRSPVADLLIAHSNERDNIDKPSLIHALTPQTLLLGCDSTNLHVYDLRKLRGAAPTKPDLTFRPHDDWVSSLTPIPASDTSTSGFPKQWITTGGNTLAVTDIRRGVMTTSAPQEEELGCSVMVSGLSAKGTSTGTKLIAGTSDGVLTLWEKGHWADQDERIIVDRTTKQSVDALALLPENLGRGKIVVAGMGDGCLRFVKVGPNAIVAELNHDELDHEGVVGLGFDASGRMFSGGGRTVKVWHEKLEQEQGDDAIAGAKRDLSSDSDRDSDEAAESSEEETTAVKRKKRKRNKGKQKGNGILGFSGLE
jgi:WD40 repeat protein